MNKLSVLGIPDRSIKTSPRELRAPEIWQLAVQQHMAERAGKHFDLRLIDPNTRIAHSWAVRSLPAIGQMVLAVNQPDHTAEYSVWSGRIHSGYGAGDVQLFSNDRVEVTKSDAKHVLFNVYKSNGDTERYALILTGGDNWLFYNVTPTRKTRPEVQIEKPKYSTIEPKNIDTGNTKQILAPKVDGALNAFVLRKNKPIEVYSYRPSKKGPSKLIDHTFRTNLYKSKVPDTMTGSTVLLGELFAKDKQSGIALSSRDTAARLLSNVWRSRDLQKTGPIDNIVFDVARYKGKDVSGLPYSKKLEILKKITNDIPALNMPPLATTAHEKQSLISDIKEGAHPLTREGVVVYDLDRAVPLKAKFFQDFDVRVKDVFEGEGKYKGNAAGGFTYAPIEEGKGGRVGSGFSDKMRTDLWEHPESFKGLVARVIAQEKLPSGALRVPIFKDFRAETWPRKNNGTGDYIRTKLRE